MAKNEFWEPVPRLPAYEVSNLARLRYTGTKEHLPTPLKAGAVRAYLRHPVTGKRLKMNLALIVLDAFTMFNRATDRPVFINGDVANCSLSNLTYTRRKSCNH